MNILCFGDSNTWGFDADNLCRFPKEARWTTKLQEYLPDSIVSEFGICDMTFGTEDPFYKACNGAENIIPAIRANSPLDLVVVSLGINDCKKYLFNSVDKIIEDAGRLVFRIQGYSDLNTNEPRVVVCGQCMPNNWVYKYYPKEFDISSLNKLYQLNRELRRFCEAREIPYCDIPEDIKFCKDGCHYSKEGHDIFAKNLSDFIKTL